MTPLLTESRNHQEFFAIYRFLRERCASSEISSYMVPGSLVGNDDLTQLVDVGNPYRFFAQVFEQIAERNNHSSPSRELSTKDVVYQAYIRSFASLNYETGTALKQIAFLPFLKDRLNVSVFISLPSGVIGKTNRKGRAGSPFAVKNPFCIDASIGDRLLPGFPATAQYKALIQACKLIGIRPGSIVPLTVLAMDSPLFKTFPELGYWWVAEPGKLLHPKYVEQSQPAPASCAHRRQVHIDDHCKLRFVEPPSADEVEEIRLHDDVYYVANLKEGGRKQTIALANAFADPVAGEENSYTWKDVATIRYTRDVYPPAQGASTKPEPDESKPSWLIMPFLVAWRARELGEDCFLIDVNEQVPEVVLKRALEIVNHWDEEHRLLVERLLDGGTRLEQLRRIYDDLDYRQNNDEKSWVNQHVQFIAEELWGFEIKNPYISAITGPFISCVSAHSYNHELLVQSLRHHLRLLESRADSKLFFAGVANHDTLPPRARIAPLLYTMYNFLPLSIPMIFSGNEYYSSLIINKEFGFSSLELQALRARLSDEDLALFNDMPINWAALSDNNDDRVIEVIPLLEALHKVRHQLLAMVADDLLDYRFLQMPGTPLCFGYERASKATKEHAIIVCANWDRQKSVSIIWQTRAMKMIGAVAADGLPDCLAPGSTLVLQPLSVVVMGSGMFQNLSPFSF